MSGNPWIVDIEINHPETGNVLMATNLSRLSQPFSGTSIQLRAIQGSNLQVSPVFSSEAQRMNAQGELETHLPLRTIWAPMEGEGKLSGILTFHTNALEIGKYLLKDSGFFREAGIQSLDVYVVDHDGRFLSSSAFEEDLRNMGQIAQRSVLELTLQHPHQQNMTQAFSQCQNMISARDPALAYQMTGYAGYRGFPVIGAWKPVSGTGWCVIGEVDEAEMVEPLNTLKVSTIGLVTGMGILFGILGTILSSHLIAPLIFLKPQ